MLALPPEIPRPFVDMAVLAARLDATMLVFDGADRVQYVSERARSIYSFCDFSSPQTFDGLFMQTWERGGRPASDDAGRELADTKHRRLNERLEFTRRVPVKLLCSHARLAEGWSAQLRVEPHHAGLEHYFADDAPAMSLIDAIRQREEASLRAAALDCLGLGVAVVTTDGKVRYQNAAMGEILAAGDGLHLDAAGRLRLEQPEENDALIRLMAGAATGRLPRPQITTKFSRSKSGEPHTVSISKGPSRLDDTAIVIVAAPVLDAGSVADVLRQDFGLTPAEAEMAARVGGGQETSDAAAALGKSPITGREQMMKVYRKLKKESIPVSGQPGLARFVSVLTAITGAARRRGK